MDIGNYGGREYSGFVRTLTVVCWWNISNLYPAELLDFSAFFINFPTANTATELRFVVLNPRALSAKWVDFGFFFVSQTFSNPRSPDMTYELCSVIHHSGSLGGGHYTCSAKVNKDVGGWNIFVSGIFCIIDIDHSIYWSNSRCSGTTSMITLSPRAISQLPTHSLHTF